jgi:hypothetical protein
MESDVFVFGKFLQPDDQKKGLANPTKRFLKFVFKESPSLNQKNLEVARFRQCVPIGHQN